MDLNGDNVVEELRGMWMNFKKKNHPTPFELGGIWRKVEEVG